MTSDPQDKLLRHQDAQAVLMVDDEPYALKWFARRYGDEFVVLTAGSAQEALLLLESRGHEVAVLLTDFRMPHQDGVVLLATACQRFAHVSRVLMSAYADKDVAMAAVNQGQVEQILEKPLDEVLTRQVLRDARAACRERLRAMALLRGREENLRETLGFFAHEIGTPLATVSGYLHAIRERQHPAATAPADPSRRDPGEVQAMLDSALRRTEFAQSLVTTFVKTARDAYRADESVSRLASDLVRSVQRGYPFEDRELGWLDCRFVADFPLPGHRDLLYLVFCTLVKNAVMALHSAPPARPRIQIVVGSEDRAHIIRVIDNGPGIPSDVLPRLTREPVTTRADSGGSGMGLVFCQRVLTSLGGQVDVKSPSGGGAEMVLSFGAKGEQQPHEVSQ